MLLVVMATGEAERVAGDRTPLWESARSGAWGLATGAKLVLEGFDLDRPLFRIPPRGRERGALFRACVSGSDLGHVITHW